MLEEVIWTAAAEHHFQQAYDRLENLEEGRGELLYHAVDEALSLLRRFPEMATRFGGLYRRWLIRKSKYGLFYRVHGKRLVVMALLDLRGDPRSIRRELGLP